MTSETDKRAMQQELVTRLLQGAGRASPDLRRAAFDNAVVNDPSLRALVSKVALQPTRVTDRDLLDVKVAGRSEDEIFELVVCAAVGQASRQYEAALSALGAALAEATAG